MKKIKISQFCTEYSTNLPAEFEADVNKANQFHSKNGINSSTEFAVEVIQR